MTRRRIGVEIYVDDKGVSRGVVKSNKHLDTVEKKGRRVSKNISDDFTKMGGIIAGAFAGVSVVRFFGDAINAQREFGQSLSDLKAVTNLPKQAIQELSLAAQEMGKSTVFSASQAADAFKLVASNKPEIGKSTEALKEVTNQVLIFAQAAGVDLPQAAEVLTGAMNQFGASASEAGRFADAFAAGVNAGSASVPELAHSMEEVGSVAAVMNASVEETVALLELLALSGIKGGKAGTGLKNVLLKLETSANQNLRPSVVGVTEAFAQFAKKSADATELSKFFGLEAVAAGAALSKMQEKIDGTITAVSKQGEAMRQASDRTNNLAGDIKGYQSALEGLFLTLTGGDQEQFMRNLVQTATEYLRLLDKMVARLNIFKRQQDQITAAFKEQIAEQKTQKQVAVNLGSAIGGSLSTIATNATSAAVALQGTTAATNDLNNSLSNFVTFIQGLEKFLGVLIEINAALGRFRAKQAQIAEENAQREQQFKLPFMAINEGISEGITSIDDLIDALTRGLDKTDIWGKKLSNVFTSIQIKVQEFALAYIGMVDTLAEQDLKLRETAGKFFPRFFTGQEIAEGRVEKTRQLFVNMTNDLIGLRAELGKNRKEIEDLEKAYAKNNKTGSLLTKEYEALRNAAHAATTGFQNHVGVLGDTDKAVEKLEKSTSVLTETKSAAVKGMETEITILEQLIEKQITGSKETEEFTKILKTGSDINDENSQSLLKMARELDKLENEYSKVREASDEFNDLVEKQLSLFKELTKITLDFSSNFADVGIGAAQSANGLLSFNAGFEKLSNNLKKGQGSLEDFERALENQLEELRRTEAQQLAYNLALQLNIPITEENIRKMVEMAQKFIEMRDAMLKAQEGVQGLGTAFGDALSSGLQSLVSGITSGDIEAAFGDMLGNLSQQWESAVSNMRFNPQGQQIDAQGNLTGGFSRNQAAFVSGAFGGATAGLGASQRHGFGTTESQVEGTLNGLISGASTGSWAGAIAGLIFGAISSGVFSGTNWESIGEKIKFSLVDGLTTDVQRFNVQQRDQRFFGGTETQDAGVHAGSLFVRQIQNDANAVVGTVLEQANLIGASFAEEIINGIDQTFEIHLTGLETPEEIQEAYEQAFRDFQNSLAGRVVPLIGNFLDGNDFAGILERLARISQVTGEGLKSIGIELDNVLTQAIIDSIEVGNAASSIIDSIGFPEIDPKTTFDPGGGRDRIGGGQDLPDVPPNDPDLVAATEREKEIEALLRLEAARIKYLELLTDELGGIEEAERKFGLINQVFRDTSSVIDTHLSSSVDQLGGDLQSMFDTLGTTRDSFLSDFEAIKGSSIDPADLAVWIDAQALLAELMLAEQQLNEFRGEALRLESLTVDQRKELGVVAGQVASQMSTLTGSLIAIDDAFLQAVLDMENLAGGFDNLFNSMKNFFELFFTDAEKADAKIAAINSAFSEFGLGFEDLDTRQEVRDAYNRAVAEENVALQLAILQHASLLDEMIKYTESLQDQATANEDAANSTKPWVSATERAGDAATVASTALQEAEDRFRSISQAIASASQSIQASINRVRSASFAGAGAGPLLGQGISDLYGQLGQGDVFAQIDTITQLQGLITQRFQQDFDQIQANLNAANQANNAQISGLNDVRDTAQSVYQEQLAQFQRIQQAVEGLDDYLQGLLFSGLQGTPQENLDAVMAEFLRLRDLALGGDEQAINDLRGISQTLIDLARDVFASSSDFDDIFNLVTSTLRDVIDFGRTLEAPDAPQWTGQLIQAVSGGSSGTQQTISFWQDQLTTLQEDTIKELEALQAELTRLQEEAQAELDLVKAREENRDNMIVTWLPKIGEQGTDIKLMTKFTGIGNSYLSDILGRNIQQLDNSYITNQRLADIPENIALPINTKLENVIQRLSSVDRANTDRLIEALANIAETLRSTGDATAEGNESTSDQLAELNNLINDLINATNEGNQRGVA